MPWLLLRQYKLFIMPIPKRGGAEASDITEALKATNQMTWVGRMDNIRSASMEIINKEIIFAYLIFLSPLCFFGKLS